MRWIGPWTGGRVRELKDGSRRWYIVKRLGKGVKRTSIALESKTLEDAEVEFKLWHRDPAAFKTKKQHVAAAIRKTSAHAAGLDVQTLSEFALHVQAKKEKGELSKGYVERVLRPYLKAWALSLGGKPFRDVTLSDLHSALDRWPTAKQKRIVAIKAFTKWARTKDKLKRRDDPTLDLEVPANVPEQNTRAKGYSRKQVEELYRNIQYQVVRDMILIRAKTGVHESEIDRVARGKGELIRVSDPSGIEGVIVFAHLKKGAQHAISVDAQTFAAFERLVARGRAASNTVVVRELARVAIEQHGCDGVAKSWKKARPKRETVRVDTLVFPCPGCKPMRPSELRHTFATLSTTVGREVHAKGQRGVELGKVSERMGHLGKRTTKAFYIGNTVPMMIALPLQLVHQDDPT